MQMQQCEDLEVYSLTSKLHVGNVHLIANNILNISIFQISVTSAGYITLYVFHSASVYGSSFCRYVIELYHYLTNFKISFMTQFFWGGRLNFFITPLNKKSSKQQFSFNVFVLYLSISILYHLKIYSTTCQRENISQQANIRKILRKERHFNLKL